MPTINPGAKPSPLAALLRPANLDDVIGQTHLVGPGAPLRLMTQKNEFVSSVLWGPPGTGKTTIVRAMAAGSSNRFVQINATSAKVDDIRKILKTAQADLLAGKKTLCFIDECLPYNALIHCCLPDGTTTQKPIGEIVHHQLTCDVLSVNLDTGQYEWQPITSWTKQPPKEMVEVEVEEQGRTYLLRCSSCHPVYTTNRGWVPAGDLAEGDEPVVFCKDGLQETHHVNEPLQNLPAAVPG